MIFNPVARRPLGKTEFRVSAISYGCWGLVDGWGEAVNIEIVNEILELAWELGINLFDTAAVYGKGLGEEIFNKLTWKKEAIIATKVSSREKPIYPIRSITSYYSKAFVESEVNSSLKNLGRDWVDIIQLHNWFPEWDKDYMFIIDILETLKVKGKVRSIGISIPRQTLFYSKLPFLQEVDVIQVPINIFDKPVINKVEEIGSRSSVGILARSVLKHGIISNDVNKLQTLGLKDYRRTAFSEEDPLITQEQLLTFCQDLNIKPQELPFLSIAAILHIPSISSAIVGSRRKQHLLDNTNGENFNSVFHLTQRN